MAGQNIICQLHSVSMARMAMDVSGEENALLKNRFEVRTAFLEYLHCYYLLINLCFMLACVNKLRGKIT